MGCNCGTNVRVKDIYDRYGVDKDKRWNDMPSTKRVLYKVALTVCMMFVAPFIFAYVLVKYYNEEMIDMSKFFGFVKTVQRKEAMNVRG